MSTVLDSIIVLFHFRVLILVSSSFATGTGFAGTGALYEFQLFNENSGLPPIDYIAVDGDSHHGGRAYEARFVAGGGGTSLSELMSMFFSQNKNDAANYLLHTSVAWSDIYYSDASGQELRQRDVNQARSNWADGFSCLQDEGNAQNDLDMEFVLHNDCDGWGYSSDLQLEILERIFTWYDIILELCLELEDMATYGNLPFLNFVLLQDVDWFVTSGNYDPSESPNLARIADRVVKDYIPPGKTVLNQEIVAIDWSNADCVQVDIAGGIATYFAEKVR